MSAPRPDALTRLLRAAERELARLFAPLLATLRRFLARVRGAVLLPAHTVQLGRIVLVALRALTGRAPGLQFPHTGPTPPLPALIRATVRASAGLVTPAEAHKAAAWAEARAWRAPDGHVLSDRIWRNGQLIRRRVDETLTQAVRAGLRPDAVLTQVEDLLIGTAETGAGPANLRRVLVTEGTRAHGQAVLARAGREGGLVRWVVSPLHAGPDACDAKARANPLGAGPGIYTVATVPRFPSHPLCRCRLIHVGVAA